MAISLFIILLLSVAGIYMRWLTCRLAISKWGVCKKGGGYRLQGKTNPGLLYHVLLTLKVNVDLHSKRITITWRGRKEGQWGEGCGHGVLHRRGWSGSTAEVREYGWEGGKCPRHGGPTTAGGAGGGEKGWRSKSKVRRDGWRVR